MSSFIVTMTPEKARELLTKNDANRPLNKDRVRAYANDMAQGRWALNGEPIIISDNDRLLDGQHRLQAIIQSGATIQTYVTTGIDEKSFSTIDTGKERTPRDILAIAGIKSYSKKSAAASRYLSLKKRTTASVALLREARVKAGISNTDVLSFVINNEELLSEVISISSRCYEKIRLLGNTEVAAYMLYLILDKNHNKETVFDFFMQLFRLSPITNDTINTLFDYLNDLRREGNKTTERHIRIVKSWNAFIQHKIIKRFQFKQGENLNFI